MSGAARGVERRDRRRPRRSCRNGRAPTRCASNSERALYREKPRSADRDRRHSATAEPQTVAGRDDPCPRAIWRSGSARRRAPCCRRSGAPRSSRPRTRQRSSRNSATCCPAADHRFRMERMLYAERPKSAQRVAGLAGAKQLADAWAAVLRGDKKAGKLLDAVPAAQRSAGYLFAEAKYLRAPRRFCRGRRGRAEGAARQGRAGRSRRVVDRAARAVARAGRPRRHQDRLQAGRRTFGRADQQCRRRRIPRRLVRAARPQRSQDGGHAFRADRRRRRRPAVAVARLLLARPRRRGRRPRQCRRPISRRPRCSAPPSTASLPPHGSAAAAISIAYPDAERRRPAEFRRARGGPRHPPAARTRATPRAPTCSTATSPSRWSAPANWRCSPAMAEKRGDHFLALRVGKIAGVARPRHRRAVASGRRDPGLGQYFRRRQGARLCDRAPGERIQYRRRLRRRRARPAAAAARHRQGGGQEERPALFEGHGSPPTPDTMRRWAPPSSASSSAASTDPMC